LTLAQADPGTETLTGGLTDEASPHSKRPSFKIGGFSRLDSRVS